MTSAATSGDPASTHSSTPAGSQGTNVGDDEISARGSSEDDVVGSESGTRSRHSSTNSSKVTSMELSTGQALPPARVRKDAKWDGIDRNVILRCDHGKRLRRKMCWEGQDTGRRFLGCSKEDEDEQCPFVYWVDEEWPPRAQEAFAGLWKFTDKYKKGKKKAQQKLREAIELLQAENEHLTKHHQERVAFAERVCINYQTIAEAEAKDKNNKAWLVVFCVLGVLTLSFLLGYVIKS